MKSFVFMLLSAAFCGTLAASLAADEMAWQAAAEDPAAAKLARPSAVQYRWQEQERGMFIQLDPATLQGREYDDGTTPLKDICFEKLDTDEWVRAAKAWGAGEIIFMLAHSGGFCMWPSKTTEYHIGNTAYKGGQGDVVKEFAASCRKAGLNMGFFCWSQHPMAEAADAHTVAYTKLFQPKTRAESNAVLATRIREISERLGADRITEVWVDQPIKADFEQVAKECLPNAVLFAVGCRHPLPTIRWVGNEQGKVADPCWSVTSRARLETPAASQFDADERQKQSAADNPDGDYWAPLEADVPLHNHYWHMRPGALEHRRSVAELMACYIQSCGRNSFLLLNCAPQADGSIHPDDMKRYEEFGAAIDKTFGHPAAVLERKTGLDATLSLPKPTRVAYTDLWEDYRYGHRIRSYRIEGLEADSGRWIPMASGTAVGRRKIDPVQGNPEVTAVRLIVDGNVGTPMIRRLAIHPVAD